MNCFLRNGWPTKDYVALFPARSSPLRISDMLRAVLECTQNLSSGLLNASKLKTNTEGRNIYWLVFRQSESKPSQGKNNFLVKNGHQVKHNLAIKGCRKRLILIPDSFQTRDVRSDTPCFNWDSLQRYSTCI